MSDSTQERVAGLEQFTEWFRKNYPGPNTIIYDPDWHAPRVFRAAIAAMSEAQGVRVKDASLTQELANELLRYDRETGKLWWKPRGEHLFKGTEIHTPNVQMRQWNTRYADAEAFTASDLKGYKNGKLLGIKYQAHRVIWFLEFGFWPGVIDHINGDTSDNRLENLRACSVSENARNSAMRKGTSIFRGVSWHEQDNHWVVQIQTDSGRKRIGGFESELDAAIAYDRAAREQHRDFATLNFSDRDYACILSALEPAPVTPALAKLHTRLAELDGLCANAERRGPSHAGYVTDATYHGWCGERSGLRLALRALAQQDTGGDGDG